ncbi:MAG TPA: TolC family protein [Myxococcota bacterium]|nr:TolC family protein [Myxococcota bacterium]
MKPGDSERPEPQALTQQERALTARSRLAGVQRLPRLDLLAQAQLVDPNPRTIDQSSGLVGIWDVSAVVSWSLDGLWEAETDERGLAAERAALDADRQALDDGLRLEIASALSSMADATSQRDSAQAMIAAATEGYRVRLALFQSALATATELAEAETRLASARLAQVTLRVGKTLLDHALGRAL